MSTHQGIRKGISGVSGNPLDICHSIKAGSITNFVTDTCINVGVWD